HYAAEMGYEHILGKLIFYISIFDQDKNGDLPIDLAYNKNPESPCYKWLEQRMGGPGSYKPKKTTPEQFDPRHYPKLKDPKYSPIPSAGYDPFKEFVEYCAKRTLTVDEAKLYVDQIPDIEVYDKNGL